MKGKRTSETQQSGRHRPVAPPRLPFGPLRGSETILRGPCEAFRKLSKSRLVDRRLERRPLVPFLRHLLVGIPETGPRQGMPTWYAGRSKDFGS